MELPPVAGLIGNTPLVRLRRFETPGTELYAKAEWMNPGGSVKDRPALGMIRDALASGRLTAGKRILDATSGNTGIALAMLGAAMGVGVTLCVPRNAGPERRRMLEAYGAEIVWTSPLEGTDGAQRVAREMAAKEPDRYVYVDQYNNPANWRAHYESTAEEIWRQSEGRITHLVAGLGTTGTLVGTARKLKERKPSLVAVAVQPDGPLHGIEGMKHLESALVPGIWDPSLADRHALVSTERAQERMRQLWREEGLLVGTSSGAVLEGMLQTARPGGVLVGVFPDRGERYLVEPGGP